MSLQKVVGLELGRSGKGVGGTVVARRWNGGVGWWSVDGWTVERRETSASGGGGGGVRGGCNGARLLWLVNWLVRRDGGAVAAKA